VRQVEREPDIRARKQLGELEILVDDPGRFFRIGRHLAEQVEADAVPLAELVAGDRERLVASPAGHVAGSGAPGIRLPAGQALHDLLQPIARRQLEQNRPISTHTV
jgi:hypothetical protein